MPDSLTTISVAIVSSASAFGGVILANWLTSKRSYEERLWNLRRVAYGTIIAELGKIETNFNSSDVYISETDFHTFFEQYHSTHVEKTAMHWRRLAEVFASDYLILSDRFIELYQELDKQTADDPYGTVDPEEEYDIASDAIRKYRPLLIDRARQEMVWERRGAKGSCRPSQAWIWLKEKLRRA